jgi:hypothetical protein
MLRYRVLTLYYPEWPGEVSDQLLQEIAGNLAKIVYTVEYEIHNPLTDRLSRILRRKAGIYRVLNDVLLNTDLEKVLKDPESIDQAVASALGERTKGFKVRLRRTVVRAVMFLFITKMLLALMIELPYDLFLTHEAVPIYPLLINISFPPLFLALIGLTISIPYKKNIKDYQAAIRALASGADHQSLHLRLKQLTRSSWQILYDGLYAILFIGVYGVIAVGLSAINFHWLSITLFLFFLSLVTFFGIRIRMSTRDIVASDRRSGLVGTMFDILSLPVVRAGAWLSTKISSINVFIYFFDFIIEAPLKVAIQFVESWLVFIRDKKEEI